MITMMNVPAQGNMEYIKVQDSFSTRLMNGLKKYWAENSGLILAGLSTINGTVPSVAYINR